MGLIDDLVKSARARARALPREEPSLRRAGSRLIEAIRGKDRLDVIAEFKQASPSLGPIAERPVEEQVGKYVEAGAAAVSVLTEPTHFGGSYEDLERATRAVDAPVLMKDFVVDAAQVREAARRGARGVLLIVRCLTKTELEELAAACAHYDLTPLVECHGAEEVERALSIPNAVVGVNNRDLDTLEVDRAMAPRLLSSIPEERVLVAESGYESADEVRDVRGIADAVLIGSALMKTSDPRTLIREIRA